MMSLLQEMVSSVHMSRAWDAQKVVDGKKLTIVCCHALC